MEALKDGTQKTHASLNGITRYTYFGWIRDSFAYCIVSHFYENVKISFILWHDKILLTQKRRRISSRNLLLFKHIFWIIFGCLARTWRKIRSRNNVWYSIGHCCEERWRSVENTASSFFFKILIYGDGRQIIIMVASSAKLLLIVVTWGDEARSIVERGADLWCDPLCPRFSLPVITRKSGKKSSTRIPRHRRGWGTSFLKEGTRANGSNLERFVSCFSWKPDVEGWIYRLLRYSDCSDTVVRW